MPSFRKSRVWPVGEKGKCDAFKHPGFGKQEFKQEMFFPESQYNIFKCNSDTVLYIIYIKKILYMYIYIFI